MKGLQHAIRSHAVPTMPYDPGEQGVPMHSEAPGEEGQGEASRAIFPRAGTAVTSGRRFSRDLAINITNSSILGTAYLARLHRFLTSSFTHARKLTRFMDVTSTHRSPARPPSP